MTHSKKVQVLKALSDENRYLMVGLIQFDKTYYGKEFARMFKISESAVTQHLDVLEDAGIIVRYKEGRKTLFEIRRDDSFVRSLLRII